jgi:hypothetical protein
MPSAIDQTFRVTSYCLPASPPNFSRCSITPLWWQNPFSGVSVHCGSRYAPSSCPAMIAGVEAELAVGPVDAQAATGRASVRRRRCRWAFMPAIVADSRRECRGYGCPRK